MDLEPSDYKTVVSLNGSTVKSQDGRTVISLRGLWSALTKSKQQVKGYLRTETGYLLFENGGKLVIERGWNKVKKTASIWTRQQKP